MYRNFVIVGNVGQVLFWGIDLLSRRGGSDGVATKLDKNRAAM